MAVYRTISIVFSILEYAILARVLITWLPIPKENKLIRMLYMITEPILAPIRTLIAKSSFSKNMMFDISPIVALVLIMIIKSVIFNMIKL